MSIWRNITSGRSCSIRFQMFPEEWDSKEHQDSSSNAYPRLNGSSTKNFESGLQRFLDAFMNVQVGLCWLTLVWLLNIIGCWCPGMLMTIAPVISDKPYLYCKNMNMNCYIQSHSYSLFQSNAHTRGWVTYFSCTICSYGRTTHEKAKQTTRIKREGRSEKDRTANTVPESGGKKKKENSSHLQTGSKRHKAEHTKNTKKSIGKRIHGK